MSTFTIKRTMSLTAMAAAIALGSSLAGCGKQDVEKLLAEAKQYEQKGEHKAAVIQLKNALQKNPDDRDVRYLLGTIYLKTGDGPSAEKEIRKAVSLGMDVAQALPDLARSLSLQGQFQKVLDETQGADYKGNAALASLRGNAYLSLGKKDQARESLEQALQARPDYPEALIGLARLALSQGDVAGANRLIAQATTKNSQHVESWLFKGDLERAQSRVDEALAAYGQVLKIKPGDAAAHIARAYVEIGSGKPQEAQADIDAAKKSNPNGLLVFYTQALLDFSQKKHAAALESLQQVLRAAPEHMPSVLLAGAVQFALGSTEQAEQHLKKYLEQNPGNLYARKLLASALMKNGQTPRAIATLAPALKDDARDAHLYMLAGEAHMQARDFTKANEYFEKANALAPNTALVHTALGMSKLGQGENERAIAELEKAANLDAKTPQAGILLVMTHLRQKEYDKALAAVLKLEKDQPDNPIVHNLKGGLYVGRKELANARASFEKAVALQPGYFAAVQNLAQLDMQNKQPEAAKKRYLALLEQDKKNLQAMLALASMSLAQGKNDEVKTWLERAVADHPDAVQPAALLIGHYLRAGDKPKALTLAAKLQSTHPNDPKFLGVLADTQLANGDQRAALESFSKLAVLQPESAQVQYRIASTSLAMKDEAAAVAALKKSQTLDPAFFPAQLALAGIEVQKGRFEEALAIARQMQKHKDGQAMGHALEGDILMAQKKPALAVSAYERGAAVAPNGLAFVKMHGALVQAGKGADADARLGNWLKDNPTDVRARLYLANYKLLSKQNKAAIEQLQSVLKIEPQNALALNNLAWALGQEKDPRALQYAEQAYKLAPENPAILDTLGWMLAEKGDVGRGLPLLQKASGLAPASADIRYHYVQALAKSGDKSKARKELEQLLVNTKGFSQEEEARALLKQL